MKIATINSTSQTTTEKKTEKQVSFKSAGMAALGLTGAIMQGIENKGYFASFLIQDGLGMTIPRVITGFHRDKEITGEYNIREGLEVLGREGLTGPFMVMAAPLMLAIAGLSCKSTNTNTRLIKIIGENMKNMLKSPEFDQSIKKDKAKFKKEFYKYNISKFYKETVPNDKETDNTINYILEQMDGFNSKSKKVRNDSYKNILSKINDRIIESSPDLDNICRLNISVDGNKKSFISGDVIKAIRDYGNDAIENNKQFADIDVEAAENIKNNFATKRAMLNIGTIAATLTGLSYLPKLYARSDVAPGAMQLIKEKEQQKTEHNKENDISFKGKGINNNGFLSKIGKFLTKNVPEWVNREFEYSGYNFTPTLMACLSLFGLLLPRGIRAYNRAYIDENGKRDRSEINEILLRDSISSLAVVYTVPILTKCLVNSYENNQGFILTNRASQNKSEWQKFIDVINPYSDLKVLTNTEIEALYDNINNKTKMLNFANFVDKKGGDLEKILTKSKSAKEVFNDNTFTLNSLKGKPKADKNKQIIDLFSRMKDGEETNALITKLMKDSGVSKQSTITRIARGLNSVPGLIVTAAISPIILGIFIPMLTYANTRKAHEKMLQNNSASQNDNIAKKSYVV